MPKKYIVIMVGLCILCAAEIAKAETAAMKSIPERILRYEYLFALERENTNAYASIIKINDLFKNNSNWDENELKFASQQSFTASEKINATHNILEKYSDLLSISTTLSLKKYCEPPIRHGAIAPESASTPSATLAHYLILSAYYSMHIGDDIMFNDRMRRIMSLYRFVESGISGFADFVISSSILERYFAILQQYGTINPTPQTLLEILYQITSIPPIRTSYYKAIYGDAIKNNIILTRYSSDEGKHLPQENRAQLLSALTQTVSLQQSILSAMNEHGELFFSKMPPLQEQAKTLPCLPQIPVCGEHVLPRPDYIISLEDNIKSTVSSTATLAYALVTAQNNAHEMNKDIYFMKFYGIDLH